MITTIVVGLVLLGSIAVLAKIVLNKIKETNMSVETKIQALNEAVADLSDRVAALPNAGLVAELEAAIAAERAAAVDLAALEKQEDVDQNAELAEAQGEVDRLIAEALANEAALDAVKADVDAIAKAPEVEPEEPVVDEPVEEVVPEDDAVVPYEGEPATATDEDGNPVV